MVRPARAEDVPELVDLGRAFYATAALSEFMPFDAEVLTRHFLALLTSVAIGFFVVERDARVVGMAMVAITPTYYSSELLAQEAFWYVDPKYRGSFDSLRLFSALEKWARSKGAAVLMMSALSSNSGVSRIYERRGYVPQEAAFVKGLK